MVIQTLVVIAISSRFLNLMYLKYLQKIGDTSFKIDIFAEKTYFARTNERKAIKCILKHNKNLDDININSNITFFLPFTKITIQIQQ